MVDDVFTLFWKQYGAENYKFLYGLMEVGRALVFLASSATQQCNSVSLCPACDAWRIGFVPLREFLDQTEVYLVLALPLEFIDSLQLILNHADLLSEAAYHCFDPGIFSNHEWQAFRQAAQQGLLLMN